MYSAYWYGKARPFPTGKRLAEHCKTLLRHGVTDYVPQWGLDNARRYLEETDARKVCSNEGVTITLGLGLDTQSQNVAAHEAKVTAAILDAQSARVAGLCERVSLDWEGWWNGAARKAAAARIAARVLEDFPDAPKHTDDCPWWAPLSYIDDAGRSRATHPGAPTVEFGRLVGRRYVQAYGAQKDGSPDGRSLRFLNWSRHPSQYASLGRWEILPTTQLYARSLRDQIATLTAEPEQRLWTFNQIDPQASLALRVVAELERRGFVIDPGMVTAFQRSVGLVADGIVGPKTLAALQVRP